MSFLEKLEPNHLKIDPLEFSSLCEKNAKKLEALNEQPPAETDPNESTFKPFKEFNNIAENAEGSSKNPVLETEMTELQQSQLTNIRKQVQELKDLFPAIDAKRLKFINKDFLQLNVCEVPELLNEYKLVTGISAEIRKKVNELWSFCEEIEGNAAKNKKKKGFFGIF